jgi:hypothetical protein
MTSDDVKRLLEDNFKQLSSMSVKEYTLYRKWVDLQKRYPISSEDVGFFGFVDEYPILKPIRDNLWVPKSPDDYLSLEPEMVLASDKEKSTTWNILRDMCHSAVWHSSPGRLLRYYVIDKVSGKYLGFISLGSDFIGVGGRDKHIGWTSEHKMKQGRLRHTAMGSSIAAVQPFGFNYNGGKLIALLTASEVVQNHWKERYDEDLVGVTTTSLYGGASMYNRLKYWRKCESTLGNISIEPSEDIYHIIKDWYRKQDPEKYKKDMSGSHPKTRVISSICKLVGVRPPVNNAPRGVYWNELFVDTKDFLCCRIDKVSEKKYDNSIEALTSLWKEKYAKKRVNNILSDDRWSNDILFYEDMIYNSWDYVKKKYLEN